VDGIGSFCDVVVEADGNCEDEGGFSVLMARVAVVVVGLLLSLSFPMN
jgi:hypothetical protein